MTDPRAKYQEALAAFAAPGGRWANKGALTYWGKAAGLTADEIVADARAAGVTDRDADIRRGWADARPKGEAVRGAYVPRAAKPMPPRFPAHVRNILTGMEAEQGAVDWVREISPCLDWLGKPPEAQTAAFIRAAFRPDERLFVFHGGGVGTKGVPNLNIRTAAEWLDNPNVLRFAGDLVKTNPFTGEMGRNKNGQPSYVSEDCIADFPFVLMEFDDVRYAFGDDKARGLAWQYAFWRGFILRDPLAPALVSLTYSGGKSLHGLLHVGAKTRKEWDEFAARLIGLFAADKEHTTVTDANGKPEEVYPYRIDLQALHPLIGTRLPGVLRRDKGTMQELVYLNPEARKGG